MAEVFDQVSVREQVVTIPTYRIGKPDKNPMFLEKRVYQGSSGVVYPYPVIDHVYDEKDETPYHAIFLENRYLKIMLLPELGGRVQMALDKTNGYHFVYYNRVIKPALVGLAGPWISGGIEFNWPQHHRPSTFDPVDFRIVANDDGGKTVWMGEIERMFRTKGAAGFTLYPNRAYLEISVQLYNRTAQPQTFLWWANPAVHVNDDYQSIFPPDVHAVMDHGKRAVSTFPIATGTYYKVDYAPGTDISRYKNIPVPISYMAYHSDFDFLGCYDHGAQAGMMHVANHYLVPGKKQWTWGNGDFGHAWDRQLTDEDGPYIELMCGAYTDNQPDFSWLQPGEEKRFTQVFMPFKSIGGAKNASKDVVINLDIEEQQAQIGVYLTSPRQVTVQLLCEGQPLFEQTIDLAPEAAFMQTVTLPTIIAPQLLMLRVLEDKRELIAYTPRADQSEAVPQPASAAKLPSELASNDELFLNGLHLEQYRHATYAPEPYYLEALRRDPLDSRCNNAMGLLLLRRGMFAEAESYFRTAVESVTRRNPNPYDSEPYYHLGIALKMQGRYDEAFESFYRAVWNAAWQSSGYFELARLACHRSAFEEALDLAQRSLAHNQQHQQARHLKIALLRHLGFAAEAKCAIDEALQRDCLDVGALFERYLLEGDDVYRRLRLMHDNVHTYIEISLDYAHAGLFEEAIALLRSVPADDPLAGYFLGWYYDQSGDGEAARDAFAQAMRRPPDYGFPQQIESVLALQCAMTYQPQDARAPYYLGNFWYGHRRYEEAITCWEQSHLLDPTFSTVARNLGLAYVNKRGELQQALGAYQRAFALDSSDARVFFELDQLHKKLNEPPTERLSRLEQHIVLVHQRDDLMIEYVTLLNLLGRHGDALDILLTRHFHPWEGGEGKVTEQYVISLVALARQHNETRAYREAIDLLERAKSYPANLGEGKLYNACENNIDYYMGCAYDGLGDYESARRWFTNAASGTTEFGEATYYNDQPPDMIFYQALALRKLHQADDADQLFHRLTAYGNEHLNDATMVDYFAVSLPDFLIFDEDLDIRHKIHCYYMMALGKLGLENYTEASELFDRILSLNGAHVGAAIHQSHILRS